MRTLNGAVTGALTKTHRLTKVTTHRLTTVTTHRLATLATAIIMREGIAYIAQMPQNVVPGLQKVHILPYVCVCLRDRRASLFAGYPRLCWLPAFEEDFLNGNDEWVIGDNDRYSFAAKCVQRLNARLLPDEAVPLSWDNLTGRQKRLLLYYHVFATLWGAGTAGQRVVLPACIVVEIRSLHPDSGMDALRNDEAGAGEVVI
jgi:hypothetical protein